MKRNGTNSTLEDGKGEGKGDERKTTGDGRSNQISAGADASGGGKSGGDVDRDPSASSTRRSPSAQSMEAPRSQAIFRDTSASSLQRTGSRRNGSEENVTNPSVGVATAQHKHAGTHSVDQVHEVEDVVRSGIVSRILASVSGSPVVKKEKQAPNSPTPVPPVRSKGDAALLLERNRIASESGAELTSSKSDPSSFKAVHSDSSGNGAKIDSIKTNSNPDKPIPAYTSGDSNKKSIPSSKTTSASSSSTAPTTGKNDQKSNQTLTSVTQENVNGKTLAKATGDSLVPSHSGSHYSSQRDGQTREERNVTILDISGNRKKNIGGEQGAQSKNSSLGDSKDSSKSREITSKRGEIYPPSIADTTLSSVTAKEVIASEIPQSLSTDSGIGSPTDINKIIDPGGGRNGDEEKFQKKSKETRTSTNSPIEPVVSPYPSDRPQNYRPCVDASDSPSVSSSSDILNYLPASGTTERQSLHAVRASNNGESDSGNSLLNSRNVEDDTRKSDVADHSPIPKSCATSQNATKIDQIASGLSVDQPLVLNTQRNFSEVANKDGNSLEKDATNISVIDSEKSSAVIHTLNTTEFTIESETKDDRSKIGGKTSCSIEEDTGNNVQVGTEISHTSLQRTDNRSAITGNDVRLNDQEVKTTSAPPLEDGIDAKRVNFFSPNDLNAELDKTVPEKPKRSKPSFRDVNLQEVISLSDSPDSDRKIKGILKTKSAPVLNNEIEGPVGHVEVKNGVTAEDLTPSRSVSFKKTHTKSIFSYHNAAFEGEIITEPSKRPSLADVVSHIMKQGSIIDLEDDNSHPYGRDSSLTDLMTGKRRDNYTMDAGKMIVWLALAIMVVSLAGGIIFMSETYNMNHRDTLLTPPTTEGTTRTNFG